MAVGKWSSSDKALSLLLLIISCAACASGTTYTVGDASGWNLNVNYDTWTTGKTFVPGDFLEFIYSSSQHNVEEVNSGDFSACSSSNTISRDATGNTTIPLSSVGTRYFICGISNHCRSGMQLQINVTASSTASPPPPPPPPPPPASSSPTPTSNNSAAGILSPVLAAAVVCAGLLVVELGVF